MTIFFIIALALVLVAFYLDYSISVTGLRKGVALEGNYVVQKLYGTKPTPGQLFIGLMPQEVTAVLIGSLLFWYYIGAGIFLALIARHIQNYIGWKKLGA